MCPIYRMRRNSSVGTATCYRLDGPGTESRLGAARFSAIVHTVPVAHPASYTIGTGSFPGVKRPGRGVDALTPSSAQVKERVEPYLYSLLLGLRGFIQGDLYLYPLQQREEAEGKYTISLTCTTPPPTHFQRAVL